MANIFGAPFSTAVKSLKRPRNKNIYSLINDEILTGSQKETLTNIINRKNKLTLWQQTWICHTPGGQP